MNQMELRCKILNYMINERVLLGLFHPPTKLYEIKLLQR